MFTRLLQYVKNGTREPLLTRIKKRPFQAFVTFLCLINVSLILVNVGLWFIAAGQKLFVAADFTAFYTGYSMVRAGDADYLYDLSVQSGYQQALIDGLVFEGGVLPYLNPPYVALIFSPLAFLPLNSAFYLWSFIQLGLLIWSMIILNRLFARWSMRERAVMFITILAFWPLMDTFILGQFSLLLLISCIYLYITMQESRLSQAGVWMAILAIKPYLLLIPGTMVLNKRYARVAIFTALILVSIFILSLFVIGILPWIGYVRSLKSFGSYFGSYGLNPGIEYSLRGVLSNILGSDRNSLTNAISIIALLLGMFGTWFLWSRSQNLGRLMFSLTFAFTLLVSIFLSLHLNPHDALLLVLPAALFYDYLRENGFYREAYISLLLVSPMVFLFSAFNDFNFFGFLRPPVVILLVMLAWVSIHLVSARRADRTSQTTVASR